MPWAAAIIPAIMSAVGSAATTVGSAALSGLEAAGSALGSAGSSVLGGLESAGSSLASGLGNFGQGIEAAFSGPTAPAGGMGATSAGALGSGVGTPLYGSGVVAPSMTAADWMPVTFGNTAPTASQMAIPPASFQAGSTLAQGAQKLGGLLSSGMSSGGGGGGGGQGGGGGMDMFNPQKLIGGLMQDPLQKILGGGPPPPQMQPFQLPQSPQQPYQPDQNPLAWLGSFRIQG